jgi:hypothetical protein
MIDLNTHELRLDVLLSWNPKLMHTISERDKGVYGEATKIIAQEEGITVEIIDQVAYITIELS